MKTRLLGALVGLAISFALPTFAQQKETVDPKIIEQLNAIPPKFDEAVNNNDAVAVAALFTEDAIYLTDMGPIYGRQAVEKQFAEWFKGSHHSNHMSKHDPNSFRIVGTADKIAANGEWSETDQPPNGKPFQLKGYWSAIDTREGDAWKIWMLAYNITLQWSYQNGITSGSTSPPAPATTSSPTTTPSSQ
jgi:ketosteroid isomerase-like protein